MPHLTNPRLRHGLNYCAPIGASASSRIAAATKKGAQPRHKIAHGTAVGTKAAFVFAPLGATQTYRLRIFLRCIKIFLKPSLFHTISASQNAAMPISFFGNRHRFFYEGSKKCREAIRPRLPTVKEWRKCGQPVLCRACTCHTCCPRQLQRLVSFRAPCLLPPPAHR